jgi:hypothetical protein
METNENQTDYKQEKFRSLSIPMPLKLMETKRGWNGERREGRKEAVYFFNTHAMVKGEALERNDTQKNMSAQASCRVPQPGCTKCTKHLSGS